MAKVSLVQRDLKRRKLFSLPEGRGRVVKSSWWGTNEY